MSFIRTSHVRWIQFKIGKEVSVFWPFCSPTSNHTMERFWGQCLPHFPAQSRSVEPLLWDSSIQGAPPFTGHEHGTQDLVPEKCHIIFVFVASIEETPLFRGTGHFFWVPKPEFNLYSGITLAIKVRQKWLTTKNVDFKCSLVTGATAFKTSHNIEKIS